MFFSKLYRRVSGQNIGWGLAPVLLLERSPQGQTNLNHQTPLLLSGSPKQIKMEGRHD